MPRSASDATRFTATAPHAYSKAPGLPPRNVRSTSQSSPPRGGSSSTTHGEVSETPAQKVARLRAAHLAKRAQETSIWDRAIVRARLMADTAHRLTVYGLMGLTVLAVGITAYSASDMIMHNRRKRRQYFAEQTMMREQQIAEAKQAQAAGKQLNEEQTLLLNQELAKEMAAEEKKNKQTVWTSVKGAFSSDHLKKEDQGLEDVKETIADGKSKILSAVSEVQRGAPLQSSSNAGGPLDRLGEQTADALAQKKKSWSSWITGN